MDNLSSPPGYGRRSATEDQRMKIDETFSIPCPECGETEFSQPEPLDDETFVTCRKCGFSAPLIDIKEHGRAKAKEHLKRQAKAAIETELKRLFK